MDFVYIIILTHVLQHDGPEEPARTLARGLAVDGPMLIAERAGRYTRVLPLRKGLSSCNLNRGTSLSSGRKN